MRGERSIIAGWRVYGLHLLPVLAFVLYTIISQYYTRHIGMRLALLQLLIPPG